MSSKWLKIALPIVVLVGGVGGMSAIQGMGKHQEEKEEVDVRPTVSVETLQPQFHQVQITGHGEVRPVESTMLSAQVSGEVVKWHPNFVAGGLVKRGEVLFEIEKDSYEVALLQAQSTLASTKSALIEEQGRADVAKREAKTLPNSKVTDLYLRKPQLLSAQAAVKLAEASVKLAKRDLANCTVVAPYDALVVSRNLGTGQFISTGMNIGEIYNIEMAEITFPIAGFDHSFLPESIRGTKAEVSTQGTFAYSRPGTIVRDTGIVDTDTRMSHLVVQIEDPYSLAHNLPKVLFGSFVQVSFDGQGLNDVFRLPQELVSNNSVWVLGDENKLQSKRVQVLREEGKYFLINNGLASNDKLIVTVPEYPQVGMEVKIAGENIAADQVESSNLASPAVAQSSND